MGKQIGPPIPQKIVEWVAKQHVFFVATAPLSASGRVNLSPKSAREFRIIDDTTVAYLDLTGSGSETIAHVHENSRLTIMFVAFEGAPKIVRFFGKGRYVLKEDADETVMSAFTREEREVPGFRAIVVLDVQRVGDSCGYSIPKMAYESERLVLDQWAEKRGIDGIQEYQKNRNYVSIDGLTSVGRLMRSEATGDGDASFPKLELVDGYWRRVALDDDQSGLAWLAATVQAKLFVLTHSSRVVNLPKAELALVAATSAAVGFAVALACGARLNGSVVEFSP